MQLSNMFEDDNNVNINNNTAAALALMNEAAVGQWTWYEDKLFETALVLIEEGSPDRWQQISDRVPGKTPIQVKQRYDLLIHDITQIELGRVELPTYAQDVHIHDNWESDNNSSPLFEGNSKGEINNNNNNERKKGTPWTEEEHKRFLLGLKTYGKGDWRSISRNVVITRTPTQVASHAQKYYLRRLAALKKKERKRASIHDITIVEVDANPLPLPPPPPPIDQINWAPPPPPVDAHHLPPHAHAMAHLPPQSYQNYGFPM